MKPIKNAVFFACLLVGAVHAQQVFTQDVQITSQGATAPNLKTTGPGGVVFGGAMDSGSIPATGDGVRMMWYPAKGAFRAGYTSAGLWDDANIGDHSMALGGNSKASGFGAVALGSSWASGHQSFSAGWGSTATGDFAVAMGIGTASGPYTFAAAWGTATGYNSIALAGGLALGNYSFAIGPHVTSQALNSVVVGEFNEVAGDPNWPVATDPLFVVGNGSDASHPKNAFEVRRDGAVRIAKRQGDIVMGEFGNGNGD